MKKYFTGGYSGTIYYQHVRMHVYFSGNRRLSLGFALDTISKYPAQSLASARFKQKKKVKNEQ